MISEDDVLDESDVILAQGSDALAAEQTSLTGLMALMPEALAAGSYYIGVHIVPQSGDPLEPIDDLTDNSMFTQIAIAGGPISGTEAADVLADSMGSDEIWSLGGDDHISLSGQGIDFVDGSAGLDTADFSAALWEGSQGALTLIADESNPGAFSGQVYADATQILGDIYLQNVETILGTAGGDDINALGAGAGLLLSGGAGDDLIFCSEAGSTIEGGDGNDTLVGHGDEISPASESNDVIFDGAGDDLAYGGFGDDTYISGEGADTFGAVADIDDGNNTIYNFDLAQDVFMLEIDGGVMTYDVFDHMMQTTEGTLLTYGDGTDEAGNSMLFVGLDVADFTGSELIIYDSFNPSF